MTLLIAPTILSLIAAAGHHAYNQYHVGQKPKSVIWRNLFLQMTVSWFIAYIAYMATENIWSLFVVIPAIYITQGIADKRFYALRQKQKELDG